jgi:hypothetical protein
MVYFIIAFGLAVAILAAIYSLGGGATYLAGFNAFLGANALLYVIFAIILIILMTAICAMLIIRRRHARR